jgi:hypothetical protein
MFKRWLHPSIYHRARGNKIDPSMTVHPVTDNMPVNFLWLLGIKHLFI